MVQLDWIERFPTSKKLVGCAGLGVKVRDSGEKRCRGRLTKKSRWDLRYALEEGEADAHADPARVAATLFALACRMRVKNLPESMSANPYTRYHLHRRVVRAELTHIP